MLYFIKKFLKKVSGFFRTGKHREFGMLRKSPSKMLSVMAFFTKVVSCEAMLIFSCKIFVSHYRLKIFHKIVKFSKFNVYSGHKHL